MGVLPQLYAAATAPGIKKGALYAPTSGGYRGNPTERKPKAKANDTESQSRLWEVSVQMTGVDYALLEGTAAVPS